VREGLFVVLIGPDGSGKSTVAACAMAMLGEEFRGVWRFHWRPQLLPKLGRSAQQGGAPSDENAVPSEVSKYRGIVSLARFFYYWLDFVLGYWLVIYPRRKQGILVLGERYFADTLVHPARYGFSVPHCVMRLASKLVPSPDLMVLLKDDPRTIFARKPELSVSAIAAQILAYEEEMKHWGANASIITQGGVEKVAERLVTLVREGRCMQRGLPSAPQAASSGRTAWHAFPSGRAPRIWVGNRDTLANALNLWQPYSRSGQLAKSVASALPQIIGLRLLRTVPETSLCARLEALEAAICATLGGKRYAISFATGTPGPHRKMTAQVDEGGRVIAYVKIAAAGPAQKLLRQEAHMLEWVRRDMLGATAVPTALALIEQADQLLLFLSPPPKPGMRRPVTLDELDLRFLMNLARMGATAASPERILQSTEAALSGLGPRVDALYQRVSGIVNGRLAGQGVRMFPCHGDFAPWNTLALPNSGLYVFDWEYGLPSGPALGDLFHRVFMPLRLVQKAGPVRSVDTLFALPSIIGVGRLLQSLSISAEEFSAYLLLYLLHLLSQRAGTESADYLVGAVTHAVDRIRR
jgi:thymidylate kinase